MAKSPTSTESSARNGSDKENISDGVSGAIASLKEDHREAEKMFEKYGAASAEEKGEIIRNVCKSLTIHTMLEEEIFYPACRESLSDDALLDEAQVEHDSAKILIADLLVSNEKDAFRDAKLRVLAEQIRHHVAEEEKPRKGIFAQAKAAGIDTVELTRRLKERKQQLQAVDDLPPGRPTSIRSNGASIRQAKENDMASYQQATRERDDQGRFTERSGRYRDDDDDRNYSRRGSSDRPRDDEGRFMSRGGGNGSRGRRDEDDDRMSRGRGEGRGWYGDERGHSEAARRGWDEREGRDRGRDDDDDRRYSTRSRGYDRDDDDDRRSRGRGTGGWFGDSEGHSEASRRGWDNSDHAPSGWFGDPEGHSEASRRGWDHRGSSRSSRDYDDDDRGSRYGSRRRDDDEDDRRGRGGWFGDSRGHSEAARRGWDNRH